MTQTGKCPLRVVVTDDVDAVREALVMLVDLQPDMVVVAAAADGVEAIAAVREHVPDALLIDLRMPRIDGFDASRVILEEFPGQHIVMLTAYDDASIVEAAGRLGIARCLAKGSPPHTVLDALRRR